MTAIDTVPDALQYCRTHHMTEPILHPYPISSQPLRWHSARFEDLSAGDLYAALQLRSAVFVVEQSCLFQDLDGTDHQAIHLLGWRGGELLAYARCFAPGIQYAEASIGRIATRLDARGTGLGHQLVGQALGLVQATWGRQPIRIGAQARLKDFYRQHGFVDTGIDYVEDGIDHVEMLWNASTRRTG